MIDVLTYFKMMKKVYLGTGYVLLEYEPSSYGSKNELKMGNVVMQCKRCGIVLRTTKAKSYRYWCPCCHKSILKSWKISRANLKSFGK
jgi:Zn finger protein HypA/HybF involved in hydrogenase expression